MKCQLDEAKAGIKIASRNISNLRYADDTTLMAESEELKSFLMNVKEESEELSLKLNIQKTRSWSLIPSVQLNSVAQSCPILCDPMNRSMPGLPVHHQLPEFTQTHVPRVNDAIQHLILCRPFLLLPSIFPNIRVILNESAFHTRWPKYWSFSFSISPSNEHPGLISFRMDWLDLLAVQGALESLLQHHSSKASILLSSAFFIVQLSHPFMTT